MDKILIVEDDAAIKENIEIFLSSEGFSVETACNGLDALHAMEKNLPDLIISDINMPYVNGYELYKKVEEIYGPQLISFIFLSAKSDLSSIRYGLNLGAEDYITKPFDFQDLLTTVKVRLAKRRQFTNIVEELKNTISKTIPHELRTPLVTIIGYSGYISSESHNLSMEEIQSYASSVAKSGLRLHNRIEKFLNYINVESRSVLNSINKEMINDTCRIKQMPFEGLLKGIAKDYGRGQDLIVDFEEEELVISEDDLITLVNEIADNSFKFSNQGTPVTVTGKRGGERYFITIDDRGRGFETGEVELISSYRQFGRDKYQQTGVGLGLYLAQKICFLYGGSISIDSIQSEQTTVTIALNINKKGVSNELV